MTDPLPPDPLVAYFLARRKALADELRYVEEYLLAKGAITRRLCAPGRVRERDN